MPGLERTPRPTSAAASPAEFSSFVALGLSQPYSRLVEAGWAGACRRVRLQAMHEYERPDLPATVEGNTWLHGQVAWARRIDGQGGTEHARQMRDCFDTIGPDGERGAPDGRGLGRWPRQLDLPREQRLQWMKRRPSDLRSTGGEFFLQTQQRLRLIYRAAGAPVTITPEAPTTRRWQVPRGAAGPAMHPR
jgi:hypothetical protein